VATDLDQNDDPRAALPKLREWMFLAKLRSEVEHRLEKLEG